MKRSEKDMPDMYMVKVIEKNNRKNIIYGTQDRYHKSAKEAWVKKNALIVEDAITGEPYLIPLEMFDVTPIAFGSYDPKLQCMDDEYSRYVNKQFTIAQKKSNSLKGLKVGKIFNLGVGDGRAYYEITKINKGSCVIEWRGYGCDRYFDQVLGGGGSFPKHVIEPLIRSEEIFA